MKRLAIITTHPIQYYAPLFKLLNERRKILIKVFYTWGEEAKGLLFDPGFGQVRQWDIPLLEGYESEFIENISSGPGSHHFKGIDNPGLISKIVEWQANAVLIFGWKFRSHLKAMFHFKGRIPVLFYGDSTLLDEPKGFTFKKALRRLSLSVVYRFTDYALYPGINSRAYFRASGVSKRKLIFAPHAIDNLRFSSPCIKYNEEALQWKKQLKIPLDKPSVLFAGKLETKKNPLFLIEAAEKFQEIHFIILGNGILEDIVMNKSKVLENLTYLPFQNQSKMPAVYRLADIFILPSKGPGETWGLALNEAMACGRIVIASNKCGAAIDLVKNGENGFIIEPHYNNFAQALRDLMDNKRNWDGMKKKSFEIIELYNLEKLGKSIEDIIIDKVYT